LTGYQKDKNSKKGWGCKNYYTFALQFGEKESSKGIVPPNKTVIKEEVIE